YLGTPANLSSATPGFLGQATASGGFYTFNPSLTLLPATQYFFYENALIPADSITGGNSYAGGQFYVALTTNENFFGLPESFNFRVTGSPINGVPDSASTFVLLLVSVVALFGLNRLRHVQLA